MWCGFFSEVDLFKSYAQSKLISLKIKDPTQDFFDLQQEPYYQTFLARSKDPIINQKNPEWDP